MLPTLLALIAVVVPAALMARWRRKLFLAEQARHRESQVIWDFSINNDLCIGCDKCVKICPRDVLELEPATQVVQVARGSDCIQCRACDKACPTHALRMYPRGGPKPTIELPDLDTFYQPSGLKGLYLVGQSAGKPRIKNAVNLGQAAVEHMVLEGLKPQEPTTAVGSGRNDGAIRPERPLGCVDVAIIGAGPAGLAAAIACTQHGLTYVLLEQDSSPLSTIVRYPKGKLVHSLPHALQCVSPLQFQDCTKEDLVEKWQDVKAAFRIREEAEVVVTNVQRRGTEFDVLTDRRGTYQTQRVIVAIGGRGQPKLLPKVSEGEQNLPHVHKLLDSPDTVRGKQVLVAGGGDSAIEATLALSRPHLSNSVFLVYYKNKKFLGGNPENLRKLALAETMKEVVVLDQANVTAIAVGSVTVERKKRSLLVPIDEVYVLIGSHPNQDFLNKIGIVPKTFDQGSFSREATDQLVHRLLEDQRKKGIRPVLKPAPPLAASSPPAPVNSATPSSPDAILATRWEPNRAEQIRRQHEESSAPAPADVSLENAPLDPIWQTRFESNSAESAASLHAQATTERLTATQSSGKPGSHPANARTDQRRPAADATPLSEPSRLTLDQTVYRTIRIPTDQYLWRMPDKAEVPKHALTLAEREAANRTTERKLKR